MDEPPHSEPPPRAPSEDISAASTVELGVTLDLAAGTLLFEWTRPRDTSVVARGTLVPQTAPGFFFRFHAYSFQFQPEGIAGRDHCGVASSSVHAMFRRVRANAPEASNVRIGVLSPVDLGPAQAGVWHLLLEAPPDAAWKWLGRFVVEHARGFEGRGGTATRGETPPRGTTRRAARRRRDEEKGERDAAAKRPGTPRPGAVAAGAGRRAPATARVSGYHLSARGVERVCPARTRRAVGGLESIRRSALSSCWPKRSRAAGRC